MGNVFRVSPVRVKRANGQVLTPDMEIYRYYTVIHI